MPLLLNNKVNNLVMKIDGERDGIKIRKIFTFYRFFLEKTGGHSGFTPPSSEIKKKKVSLKSIIQNLNLLLVLPVLNGSA